MNRLTAPQVRGVVAMVGATALLVLNDAISKKLSEAYPIGQILFWRQMIGAVTLLGLIGAAGRLRELRVFHVGGQLYRGGLFVANTFLIIYSLSILPLPVVSAILFSSPVVIAVMSGPMLGETVTLRRWAAALVGFVGVLVIVRPGGAAFTWLLLAPLAPVFVSSLRDIVTRRLTRTETSLSILFWSNVLILPVALGSAWLASPWQPLTPEDLAWLGLNGLINLGAHFLMIHALRIADASLVAPFKYSGLIWAFLLGFAVWGYWPDAWTLAGSALIVASGLYALQRTSARRPVSATLPPVRLPAASEIKS